MNRIMERIIPLLMGGLLLVVAIYQLSLYLYRQLDTTTVYEYTVSRSVETRGIAIRDEEALPEAATGMEHYLVADAGRVALGETVAELYRGGAASRTMDRTRELQQELELLLAAQQTPVDYAGTELYNRDVKQQLGELAAMAATGHYQDLPELRRTVTDNLNRKQISSGKVGDFAGRISLLQGQLQSSERSVASGIAGTIEAASAGYFSKAVDGYESRMNPETVKNFGLEDYLRIIESGAQPLSTSRAGKLVYDQNWIFAATVPSTQLEWLNEEMIRQERVGLRLWTTIQFDNVAEGVPAYVAEVVTDKGADTAVLLLRCNRMNSELINLRVSGAVLHFKESTGLRIDTADLRFRTAGDGTTERGVYILRNNKVYFRLVDPVYEEATFVLSRTYYSQQEYLEPQYQAYRRAAQEEPEERPTDPSLEETASSEASGGEESAEGEGTSGSSTAGDDGENEEEESPWKHYVMLFDQVVTRGTDLYDGKIINEF